MGSLGPWPAPRSIWRRGCQQGTHITSRRGTYGADSVVQKGGKVTAASENLDAAARRVLPGVVQAAVEAAKVGVHDLLQQGGADLVQLGSRRKAGAGARYGDVNVDIGDGRVFEPVDVLLDPLDGPDEAVFLGVPGREDTLACQCRSFLSWGQKVGAHMFRFGFQPPSISFLNALVSSTRMADPELGSPVPPGAVSTSISLSYLRQRHTNHPRVAVVSNHERLVRVGAVDDANDVPDGRDLALHDVLQGEGSSGGRAGAVLGIQSALPDGPVDLAWGQAVAVQGREERFGSTERDGERGDLGCDLGGILARYTLLGSISRRGWVTGVCGQEED